MSSVAKLLLCVCDMKRRIKNEEACLSACLLSSLPTCLPAYLLTLSTQQLFKQNKDGTKGMVCTGSND